MFGSLGGTEVMVLLALGVLLFGGRLPQIMRKLGQGVTEFRRGVQGIEDDVRRAVHHAGGADEEDERAVDEVPKFQTDEVEPPTDNEVPKFQSQL